MPMKREPSPPGLLGGGAGATVIRKAWGMRRGFAIAGVVGATVAVLPASAYASDEIPASVFYPHIGVSLIGLAVAGMLLFQAIGLRKIALGGAIAERISYVILAILCLAASAITEWAVNFTDGVSVAQAQLAREVLVIVAMALLAAYFYSVRAAMSAYLSSVTGSVSTTTAPADDGGGERG
jgi:hypothetical protein